MGCNLDKRLSALERRTGDTRWMIVRPHDDDDSRVHVLESGKPESEAVIMSEPEYQLWASQQPDNVTIIRVVYPEDSTHE